MTQECENVKMRLIPLCGNVLFSNRMKKVKIKWTLAQRGM